MEIPSIFISYESGELLRKLFEENEGTDDEETEILMKITFDNSKTEKVDVSFFLQGSTHPNIQTTAIPTSSLKNSESSTP